MHTILITAVMTPHNPTKRDVHVITHEGFLLTSFFNSVICFCRASFVLFKVSLNTLFSSWSAIILFSCIEFWCFCSFISSINSSSTLDCSAICSSCEWKFFTSFDILFANSSSRLSALACFSKILCCARICFSYFYFKVFNLNHIINLHYFAVNSLTAYRYCDELSHIEGLFFIAY